MSEIKIDQIKSALTSLGLDDSDFQKLSSETIEDFSPFVDKVKSGLRDVLVSDTSFLDEISKPYKDQSIGKEKQLKKDIRKFFNLEIKEDELLKTSISDMLKRGTESIKNTTSEDIEKVKTTYSQLLEEHEKFVNEDYPKKIEERDNYWKDKLNQKNIIEEIQVAVASKTQVAKENLSFFSETFKGAMERQGLSWNIDAKRSLSLRDKDGLPAKNEDGTLLKVDDALKAFATKMQMNIKPAGQPTQGGSQKTSNSRELLKTFSVGFSQA